MKQSKDTAQEFSMVVLHSALQIPGMPSEKTLIPNKFKNLKMWTEAGSMWVNIEANGASGQFPITNVAGAKLA